MPDLPTWEPLALHCRSCGVYWRDWQPIGVTVYCAVGYLSAIRCQSCNAGPESLVILREWAREVMGEEC